MNEESGRNGASRFLIPMLLAAVALIVYPSQQATELLQFDRARLAGGELWRLISCHWTHFSSNHLLWDTAVFAVLGVICARKCLNRFCWCLIISSLAISAAIWCFLPNMQHYRGLSGLDSALFTLLAMSLLNDQLRQGQWRSMLVIAALLIAFVAKIVIEMTTGSTIFADNSAGAYVSVPLAHGLGGVVGLACALVGTAKTPRAPRAIGTPRQLRTWQP